MFGNNHNSQLDLVSNLFPNPAGSCCLWNGCTGAKDSHPKMCQTGRQSMPVLKKIKAQKTQKENDLPLPELH